MRLQHGDATYLGDGWGELAGLVSQDGDFLSHELSEDALTRLYEAGRWWSSASVRERPGVRKFLDEIREVTRPYLLVQELRDGYCEVSLRDYLLGGAASRKRRGPSFLVETGLQAFELWPAGGGDTFTMDHALVLCRRTLQLVREEKLRVERLPPVLLEVAREVRSIFLKNLVMVSSKPSPPYNTGVCIHRVMGDGEVYIVARRPESLLEPLGLRAELGGDLSSGLHSLGLGGAETLAYLIMFSNLLGDEVPVLRNQEYVRLASTMILSSVVSDELAADDGAFLFSTSPETPSRTMNLVRESLTNHKTGR